MQRLIVKEEIEQAKNKVFDNESLSFSKNSKVIEINGKEVGFYTVQFIFDKLTLEYNIFPKYRNKGYGKEFVGIVTSIVEHEYPEYSDIYLLIHMNNIRSLIVAKANGYKDTTNYEFKEKVNEEMSQYGLYSRSNTLYTSKHK